MSRPLPPGRERPCGTAPKQRLPKDRQKTVHHILHRRSAAGAGERGGEVEAAAANLGQDIVH